MCARLPSGSELRLDLGGHTELQAICARQLLAVYGTPLVVRFSDVALVTFYPPDEPATRRDIRLSPGLLYHYHYPVGVRVMRDCLPHGWQLVRRWRRLILQHATGVPYEFPGGTFATILPSNEVQLMRDDENAIIGADDLTAEERASIPTPEGVSDQRWAEYNRRFNELLMRPQGG